MKTFYYAFSSPDCYEPLQLGSKTDYGTVVLMNYDTKQYKTDDGRYRDFPVYSFRIDGGRVFDNRSGKRIV